MFGYPPMMLMKSVQSLLPSRRGGCSKGASFTSRIHWTKKWICFKFAHVQKCANYKGKIYAKVQILNLQTPSHRGANGCANLAFTTFVQILLLVCTWANLREIHFSVQWFKYTVTGQGIITCMQAWLVGGGVGEK